MLGFANFHFVFVKLAGAQAFSLDVGGASPLSDQAVAFLS
jgi:hypothetical protein